MLMGKSYKLMLLSTTPPNKINLIFFSLVLKVIKVFLYLTSPALKSESFNFNVNINN